MKGILVAACILTSINAHAEMYQMRVPTTVKINKLPDSKHITKYTDWENTSSLRDCGEWYPNTNTIESTQSFTQKRDCKADQRRVAEYGLMNYVTNEFTVETTTEETRVGDAVDEREERGNKMTNYKLVHNYQFGDGSNTWHNGTHYCAVNNHSSYALIWHGIYTCRREWGNSNGIYYYDVKPTDNFDITFHAARYSFGTNYHAYAIFGGLMHWRYHRDSSDYLNVYGVKSFGIPYNTYTEYRLKYRNGHLEVYIGGNRVWSGEHEYDFSGGRFFAGANNSRLSVGRISVKVWREESLINK